MSGAGSGSAAKGSAQKASPGDQASEVAFAQLSVDRIKAQTELMREENRKAELQLELLRAGSGAGGGLKRGRPGGDSDDSGAPAAKRSKQVHWVTLITPAGSPEKSESRTVIRSNWRKVFVKEDAAKAKEAGYVPLLKNAKAELAAVAAHRQTATAKKAGRQAVYLDFHLLDERGIPIAVYEEIRNLQFIKRVEALCASSQPLVPSSEIDLFLRSEFRRCVKFDQNLKAPEMFARTKDLELRKKAQDRVVDAAAGHVKALIASTTFTIVSEADCALLNTYLATSSQGFWHWPAVWPVKLDPAAAPDREVKADGKKKAAAGKKKAKSASGKEAKAPAGGGAQPAFDKLSWLLTLPATVLTDKVVAALQALAKSWNEQVLAERSAAGGKHIGAEDTQKRTWLFGEPHPVSIPGSAKGDIDKLAAKQLVVKEACLACVVVKSFHHSNAMNESPKRASEDEE